LWKFESDSLPAAIPKNVMIQKWLPQNDLLSHDKVIGFINHLGLLSLHETLWRGKPIIGIPFFTDQHRNARRAVAKEIAVAINFRTLNVKEFKEAILEVIENPKYRENVGKISERFRDQQEKPLDRAVWWCEYMIRHPNPDHLHSQNFTMGLLGSLLPDIQIMILLILIIFIWTNYFMIRKLIKSFIGVASSDKKYN
jgi:hypothetical protein